MSKPEANHMWGNVDNTIQIIESRIDLISRTTDLYDPNFFLQTMMVVHNNHLIILENLCSWRNKIVFSQGSSPNVHPLMNGFLNWKYIYIQGRISQRHFHHFKINFYLHPKISPWKGIILSYQWKISIYVIMIIDVLCTVVWCLMTSSWVI